MIRRAKENQTTWLPGLLISDIPSPLPSGLKLHVRGEELGLEVQGLVGSLPLRNGDTLQIVPKIGDVNFLRLLIKAEGYQDDLENAYREFVEYAVDDVDNITEILSRHLFHSADEILRRGAQQQFVTRRRDGAFAMGRIDPVSTQLNLAMKKSEPVTYFRNEPTSDTAENRVITEAMVRAWPSLQAWARGSLRTIYDQWTRRYPRSKDLAADLYLVERRFSTSGYGGSRDYYRRALMLSRIILATYGLAFEQAAAIQGDAVLLNTADVFERYLRNVIAETHQPEGYIVTKGGLGVMTLYTDGSVEIEPDIVITKGTQTLLVADAKYKEPTSSDHYQLASYISVFKVTRGILFCPLFDGDSAIVREHATPDGIVVREVFLPLADLDATEGLLASVIQRFA